MINLTKGNTEQIIFTGTEQCLLNNPYFLFIFTNRSTNQEVKFVGTNSSSYTTRYDKVTVTVNTYFSDKDNGLWEYRIYEQLSSSNTDPDGLNMVEEGLMKLSPPSAFTQTNYAGQSSAFITYGE